MEERMNFKRLTGAILIIVLAHVMSSTSALADDKTDVVAAGSDSVKHAKRFAYLKLMEKNQNTDPFKFIIYSGKIGEQTPQINAEHSK
jgi:hypothetical protein